MIKKMKVLMIMGGVGLTKEKKFAGIFNERQADSLSKLGIEIHQVYVGKGFSLFHPLKNFFYLLYKRRKIKPDIIHAQYGSMTGFLGVLTHGKIPLIISFCGSDLLGSYKLNGEQTLKGRITVKLSRISARCASGIIVKSKGLEEALPSYYRPKARIIPTGVDLKLFCPMNKEKVRRKLQLSIDKKIVLFNVSSGESTKNLRLAKTAFELLRKKRKDVKLFLMRNEPPERVPLLMNACNVLLVTSRHEGSPNVVKEALACNLPIVSVLCGDVKERLEGVYPSFIVDYLPESLTNALNKVLEIDERSNGREKVQDLAIEKIAERIRNFYQEIIEGKL